MKHKIAYSLLFFLLLPFYLHAAKYKFDETIHIPFNNQELQLWKVGYQNANDTGASSRRYIPSEESMEHWTKLLNIQFKDRNLLQITSAVEAMASEASQSKGVSYKIYSQTPNDLIYERSFPSGEHEIVRMIMTKKGLHRAAYVKKGPFDESERNQWVSKLSNGMIGGKE